MKWFAAIVCTSLVCVTAVVLVHPEMVVESFELASSLGGFAVGATLGFAVAFMMY